MALMKLYTRQGDDGTTGMLHGRRVGKDDLRIVAHGDVDELNCVLGLAAVACDHQELVATLRSLQNHLFDLGTDLSTPPPEPPPPPEVTVGKTTSSSAADPHVSPEHTRQLEHHIDTLCAALPPMDRFILPGGCELSARLHLARAVCRRAERSCVALSRQQPVQPAVLTYLNRLSDLLFAMARRANQFQGVGDVVWSPKHVTGLSDQ